MVSIKGKNKAKVLAELYNYAKPQGLGFLEYDPRPMTVEEAEEILKETTSFDYLKGRVLKVDLSGDSFETWFYNRDNGEGLAEKIVSMI